jgi:hypothetical protein
MRVSPMNGHNDAKITTLRAAVEYAITKLGDGGRDREAREVLQALLDQKSDAYGTLCDECDVAMFG